MRVERKFYETGYADFAVYQNECLVAEVNVVMVLDRSAAMVRVATTPPTGLVAPVVGQRVADLLREAADYAARINQRLGAHA